VAVQKLFGSMNEQRCRLAVQAMLEGSPEDLGVQMTLAQEEFDAFAAPLCPKELTAPKLHAVLRHPDIQKYLYGAKGVGSQGDGSAQLLCRRQEDMQAVIEILGSMEVKCMKMTIPAS
jgi:galactokinase